MVKQIVCDKCDATFPVKNSVMVARTAAFGNGWAVGNLTYNHDFCPEHIPERPMSRFHNLSLQRTTLPKSSK